MPDGLRINADEWETFYRRTNAVAKDLKSKIRRRMREVVKPLGPDIVREGAADLPSGGGLAEHVASKGGAPTVGQSSTGARLVLGKKRGPQIGRMNEGDLRHPLYGNRKRWITQSIPAGTWTKAGEERMPEIRDRVAREMNTILEGLD